MKKDTIENNISEKLVAFEKELVKQKKDMILQSLIKPNPSGLAQLIFVFNNALLGLSLGKLVGLAVLDKSNVGVVGIVLYSLIGLASFKYVKNYWKRKTNQSSFTTQVSNLKNLKEIKKYLYNLPHMFKHSFLFLHNEKITNMQNENSMIKNEEIKDFIQSLDKEQLDFIMEALKKNTLEQGFNIQIVDDIRKLCLAKKRMRNKEEKLHNNLKVLTGDLDKENDEEDDLLNAMAESYIPPNDKKAEKINFKKIL